MRRLLVPALGLLLLASVLSPVLAKAPALQAAVATDPADARSAATTSVSRAQRRLNELRCDAGPADGTWGAHTRSAVIRFQSRHGLAQTGRLGTTTRQLLYSARARRCDLRPVPRAGSGRRIVISQRQNWVWLVAADGRALAQGGIVDNPRILGRGTYRTGSYCGRPARVRVNRSTSGTFLLDHFVRFAPCGIGFHRVPRYVSTGRSLHAEFYLGTNLVNESAGCVRLSRTLAARLWDFTAGRRTTVKVV